VLALLVPILAHAAHPTSFSRTQVRVEGSEATVEVRFQALSLLEVLPELDLAPDGRLDAREAEAGRAAVAAYLAKNLRLFRLDGEEEHELPGTLAALVPQDPGLVDPLDLQMVDVRLAFASPVALEVLVLESHLFHETNPWHRDFTGFTWNDDEPVNHTFEGGDTRWRFEPGHVRRPSVFTSFVGLGFDHIRTGYDHLAFLLALLVASRRLRTIVGVVTAFTLAHSLTLAAAALGWVHLPARFVELAIALSIAYVACDNLLRKEARNPALEAFAFGLLHGLGFAGFLGEALAGEPLVITALFGFNIGVELGQLAVVLALVFVFALVFRTWKRTAPPDSGLAPRAVRLATSAVVALLGFYWFVERAGWL